MSDPNLYDDAVSAASAGGGFATALLAGRWLINWFTARMDRKQALLDAQEVKTDLEWQAIREELRADNTEMKRRIAVIERQTDALRYSFHRVAGELTRIDPQNPALQEVDRVLSQAFPIDFSMLAERAGAAIDLADAQRPR
jgi:hypothetical protein